MNTSLSQNCTIQYWPVLLSMQYVPRVQKWKKMQFAIAYCTLARHNSKCYGPSICWKGPIVQWHSLKPFIHPNSCSTHKIMHGHLAVRTSTTVEHNSQHERQPEPNDRLAYWSCICWTPQRTSRMGTMAGKLVATVGWLLGNATGPSCCPQQAIQCAPTWHWQM